MKYEEEFTRDAINILNLTHRMGYKNVLLTSRNYKRCKSLMSRLIKYVESSRLPIDLIIFSRNKELEAGKFKDIVFIVDDDPEYIFKYAAAGFHRRTAIFYLKKDGPDFLFPYLNIFKIKSLQEIFSRLGWKWRWEHEKII